MNVRELVGVKDLVWITLDTLRYDVAVAMLEAGRTPNLAAVLPGARWEERHAPGSFTLAAHAAFFAGFLPTPVAPGPHRRPFALEFAGSTTIGPQTCVLPGASVPEGLAMLGYRTLCVGGVGFFNLQNPLGRVLPGLFAEQVWERRFGVTDPDSTGHQLRWTAAWLDALGPEERAFVFVNVSAIHQPNRIYLEGATEDTVASHAEALVYVDGELPVLFEALRRRGGAGCIVCSDHGTCYGEGGYEGHRVGHPTVWTVPYAEFVLEGLSSRRSG